MRALGLIVAALITLPAWAQQPVQPPPDPDPVYVALGRMLAEAQQREASALIAAEGQRRIAVDAQRRLAEAEAKLHAQEPPK